MAMCPLPTARAQSVTRLLGVAALASALGVLAACRKSENAESRSHRQKTPQRPERALEEPALGGAARRFSEQGDPPTERPTAQERVEDLSFAKEQPSKLPKVTEIGPAGPATVAREGVVMVTKDGRVHQSNPEGSSFSTLDLSSEVLYSFGRGPAVLQGYAYFIANDSLLRQRLGQEGEAEVLSRSAKNGTRVRAVEQGGKAHVGYLGLSTDGQTVARVWVEGGHDKLLSPEGSSASSIDLVSFEGKVVAVYLEGRTAMSPLHVRSLELKGKGLVLGEDTVAWVGGGVQPVTEVQAIVAEGQLHALIAMEKDVSTFGLAQVPLSIAPTEAQEVTWVLYPNGLDPAPVAVVKACGKVLLLLVVPEGAGRASAQELRLFGFDPPKLVGGALLARGRTFSQVSAADTDDTVSIAFGADRQTYAMKMPCRGLATLLTAKPLRH